MHMLQEVEVKKFMFIYYCMKINLYLFDKIIDIINVRSELSA